MELAIVIPYYKPDFFKATLESLVGQTDNRFKVYIGDDASSRSPAALLEASSSVLDFEYKRFDYNLGGKSLTQQWHRCLDMVQDEPWVMVLGDDDILGNNVVENFYKHLATIENHGVSVIRYATQLIDAEGQLISSKVFTHPELETSVNFLMRKLQGGTRSSLSEFVFKKDTLLSVQFKDLPLAWYSDVLAVLECSGFGNLYTINEALIFFRHSEVNITGGNQDLVLKNQAAFAFYYYLLKEKPLYFDRKQDLLLCKQLERKFLDNKKNVNFWKQFTVLYLSKGNVVNYFKFIFKAIASAVTGKNTG